MPFPAGLAGPHLAECVVKAVYDCVHILPQLPVSSQQVAEVVILQEGINGALDKRAAGHV
jgi:hypothetical protein